MQPEQECWLRGQQALHLQKVVRLRPGVHIVLYDGQGREFEACVLELTSQAVRVRIVMQRACRANPGIHLAIAQGFLKEAKMDGLVRQLTELGVSRMVPFAAHRSIGKRDPRWLTVRSERWRRIAQEALKSSGGVQIPQISPMASLAQVLQISQDYDLRLVCWEQQKQAQLAGPATEAGSRQRIIVLLGPEGGLTSEEVDAALGAGFSPLGLGPRILRADTAALAAAVLVHACFGDMRALAPKR